MATTGVSMTKVSMAKKTKTTKDSIVEADELISLDSVMIDVKVESDDSAESAVRTAVFEGIYAVVTPKKISFEGGVSVYEIPFNTKNKMFEKTTTVLTVNEETLDVIVTTFEEDNPDSLIVESSVSKIVKKDVSNAVRIAVLSQMAKMYSWGVEKNNNLLKCLVEKHDLSVKKYFQENKGADSVLHYRNLEEEIYQKSSGLSNSQLTKIADSYAHYKLSKISHMAASSAMLMGRALHCLLFTPDLFDSQFIVNTNEASGATNEGKFVNMFFDTASIGKEVLSKKEYSTVFSGKVSFMKHPIAPFLLKEAVFEESFYTMIEDFLFRGRIDCYILNPSKGLRELLAPYVTIMDNEAIVLDLKFTYDNNDNEDQFASSIVRSGYHRQGSAYCSLVERKFSKKCIFILMTVESSAPHDVTLFALDEAFMEIGSIEVSRLLTKYKAHLDNPNLYEGRNAGVKVISAPHWYIQKFGSLHGNE